MNGTIDDLRAWTHQHFRCTEERGDEIMVSCPFHDDAHPSAGVNIQKQAFRCHVCGDSAPGKLSDVASRMGWPDPPWKGNGSGQHVEQDIAYHYVDAEGRLLYDVIRREGKRFVQRAADGTYSVKGIERPPYRLPELLKAIAAGALVAVTEGEKDADTLAALGAAATCNSGGAGKWSESHSKHFPAGARVVILGDADRPGQEHVRSVGEQLSARGCVVSVCDLGYPVVEKHGRDVTDFLHEGHSPDELRQRVAAAMAFAEWVLRYRAPQGGNGRHREEDQQDRRRPPIVANDRDLREIAEEARAALVAWNKPPRVFRYGSEVVRIVDGRLESMSVERWRHALSHAAAFLELTRRGEERPCAPPLDLVRDLAAWEDQPFPELRRVVDGATFARDGELIATQGYHPSGVYLTQPIDLPPFKGDGARAAEWIGDEVFGDFPFATPADRANALGALVTCCCRDMIEGHVPLQGVEASLHGSGKGLLVDAICYIAFGGQGAEHASYTADDDEMRKHLISSLRNGCAALKLDNVKESIASAPLASLLTTHYFSDRLLGRNDIVTVVVSVVVFATVNNVALSGEMVRRWLRIRIVPSTETPWTRTGFRHPSLLEWVGQHRGEILGAIARMVETWIAAGRPDWSGTPLGSFENWCRTVGGILEASGVPGFLDNHAAVFEESDTQGEAWTALVEMWKTTFKTKDVCVSDLFPVAESIDGIALEGTTEHARRCSFGMALARQRDRVYGDHVIVRLPSKKNGARYALVEKGRLGSLGKLSPSLRTRDFENHVIDGGEKFPKSPKSPLHTEGVVV